MPGMACGRRSGPGRSRLREGNSSQVFGKESECARLSFLRARGIVAFPLVAIEAMVRRIDKDRDFRMRGLYLFDVAQRDVFVALSEMQHDRRARLLVEHSRNSAAIIADGSRNAGKARCRRPGERATPAIADDTDTAAGRGQSDRRLDIRKRLLKFGFAANVHGARAICLPVAELDPGFDPIKECRRNGKISRGRIAISDGADVMVDPENLLQDDHSALWFVSGRGAISADRCAVLRRQIYVLSHAAPRRYFAINRIGLPCAQLCNCAHISRSRSAVQITGSSIPEASS